MTYLGPRPERPELQKEIEKEVPEFGLRLQAKAGLTGYAQVYGKYNTTFYDKLLMDLMYDKKVILYAPTWRESIDGGKTYSIKPPIHFDKWQKELEGEYVVLFRAHHQTTKVLGVEYNEFVRNMSDYPAVNDLLIAADILITDYSAIAFDYSILCRPIFCYAYDYDRYLMERGTYFSIDKVYPNRSCRTEESLLQQIKEMDYIRETYDCAFVDDGFEVGTVICDIPVAGHISDLEKLYESYHLLVVAIGNNKLRQHIYQQAMEIGYSYKFIL